MSGRVISVAMVESIAKDLLRKEPVVGVAKKYKVSRPTVTAISRGEHKALSVVMRRRLRRLRGPQNKDVRLRDALVDIQRAILACLSKIDSAKRNKSCA